MLYGANPGQGLNSASLFLPNFFNIKLLKNYTYYSVEKIIEDLEEPSAKIGIFKKIMIIMTFLSNRASKQTRPFLVLGQAK
jgi:hypothetical protein